MSGRQGAAKRDEKYAGVKNFFGRDAAVEKALAEKQKKPLPDLYARDCRLCGAPLGFGRTHMGKMIALDLKAPVYAVIFEKSDSHSGIALVRTMISLVDHRATCPKVKELPQTAEEI